MSKVTRSKLKFLIYILLQETNKINRKFFQILNDFLESTLLLYQVFCYTEIEGKDRITRGFRPQKLGIIILSAMLTPMIIIAAGETLTMKQEVIGWMPKM